MSWGHDRKKGGECHRMNCAWSIYDILSFGYVSWDTLHYSIPLMSLVTSLMTLPALPKAI